MKKIILFILIIFIALFCNRDDSNALRDYHIINSPTATKSQIYKWADNVGASNLYKSWIDEGYDIAVKYKVDPTVMFAQTAIETGYGKFGGVIDSSYHNTAGIKNRKGGSNSDPNAHMIFKSWNQGLTAQAQHLALYAGVYIKNNKEIVDPRYMKELKGTAKTVNSLSSKWASNSSYGNQVNNLCDEISNTKVDRKATRKKHRKSVILETKKDNKNFTDRLNRIRHNNIDSSNYIMNELKNRMISRRKSVNGKYILKTLNR